MKAKRVVVAMSGGVDSSVCAALLQEQGLEVIGITMQIWERSRDGNRHYGHPVSIVKGSGCCGIDSIEDARKVAYQLNIPHYVLNFRDIFKQKVIDNFCREYQEGRTPNPCIRCNQCIKFDHLLKKARQLGVDYIATGHYARIEFNQPSKRYLLKKGCDAKKDQSYVLYPLTQEQLKRSLMPLGKLTKEKVREIARQRKLSVAAKPASQEICFIPDNNYAEFIQEYNHKGAKPGPIVNKEGKVIGKHKGIIFYTIGQREGIGIADKEPFYVISIDQKNNTIVVGRKEDVYTDELIADKVNFISLKQLNQPIKVKAKVRYLHPEASASVYPYGKSKVRVKFNQPQFAVTPGQAVVFYQGATVVGGGTIL